MPHRRQVQKGSFRSHFDELIVQFPAVDSRPGKNASERSQELQEKIDIHAALFERAWRLAEEDRLS